MEKVKKYRLLILFVVMFVTIFVYGPQWIAHYYMLNTDSNEIKIYQAEYWEKADQGIWNQQREYAMIWCRVRGIQIDEGHIDRTLSEKWDIVISYRKKAKI